MDDRQIIALFNERSEAALSETAKKYGRYCRTIAYNVLNNEEDSEECVNDTWLRAWESIPPQCPERLSAFLGTITRNLALNRYKHNTREKRGGGQTPLVLEELAECVPGTDRTEETVEEALLVDVLNWFLEEQPAEKRKIFMRRYWYMSSVKEIAVDFGLSESNVKMTLLRMRSKLKQTLEKEGIIL
ncbi:MAG: sigma-70 family RNA polymerase sigma factor [Lachnospiraceae bacterium]|nr:sigma-70 family RNA polymerase sigma factor [Lachnospiraceae bacterium]